MNKNSDLLQKLTSYAQLMRLHRPVGIWLLLWPTLMALWLASEGFPSVFLIATFTLGVIVMRSAGCVINDLMDRKFDGFVVRTQFRPLVVGAVTTQEAIGLFIGLLFIAFLLICTLNAQTFILSWVALILASTYPLAKRVTHFPQLVLGLAFSWGIPMAYTAQNQTLTQECWLLFFANFLWIVAYDTLYAMADREDDVKIGVKSTAIFFGHFDKLVVGCCHTGALILLFILGEHYQLGPFFYFSVLIAQFLALYQQWKIRKREPQACLQAFCDNQWFGLVLFIGVCFAR